MRLAVFTKNYSNPAYGAARIGAERAARQFGAEVARYVPTIDDDAQQQRELVARALATRPDAFVFAPVHATAVDGAVQSVQRAGIPIFCFVNPLPRGQCVSYVGADDARLARDIARRLVAHLQGVGDVAIVEGPADSVTSRDRVRAFDDVIAAHPGLRIVARCSGRYQREAARAAFARSLAEHGGFDAVLAANDIMAIGVLDALRAARRSAAVLGVNAIPQAVEAIARGEMLATADFNAMQMCFLASECAIRHLRGEAVPAAIELPAAIVDATNCALWSLPYDERPLRTLAELS